MNDIDIIADDDNVDFIEIDEVNNNFENININRRIQNNKFIHLDNYGRIQNNDLCNAACCFFPVNKLKNAIETDNYEKMKNIIKNGKYDSDIEIFDSDDQYVITQFATEKSFRQYDMNCFQLFVDDDGNELVWQKKINKEIHRINDTYFVPENGMIASDEKFRRTMFKIAINCTFCNSHNILKKIISNDIILSQEEYLYLCACSRSFESDNCLNVLININKYCGTHYNCDLNNMWDNSEKNLTEQCSIDPISIHDMESIQSINERFNNLYYFLLCFTLDIFNNFSKIILMMNIISRIYSLTPVIKFITTKIINFISNFKMQFRRKLQGKLADNKIDFVYSSLSILEFIFIGVQGFLIFMISPNDVFFGGNGFVREIKQLIHSINLVMCVEKIDKSVITKRVDKYYRHNVFAKHLLRIINVDYKFSFIVYNIIAAITIYCRGYLPYSVVYVYYCFLLQKYTGILSQPSFMENEI